MIISGAVAVTAIEFEVPVIEAVTVSVAVTVCVPAVSRVTWKFPEPVCSAALAGRIALLSVVVMCTVPV